MQAQIHAEQAAQEEEEEEEAAAEERVPFRTTVLED
jgi:hypothetical protein